SSISDSRSTPMPGEEVVWQIERRLFNQAKEYAWAARCTMRHFMLALVSCYFARVSGETDIVIGVPIYNLHSAARKKHVGMLASMLPLRITVDPEQRFNDLLKTISSELHRCYKYQRLPILEINRCANLSSSGRKSLYDVSVSFDAFAFNSFFGGLQPKVSRMHSGFAQTPVAISVNDPHESDGVLVVFEFNPGCLNFNEAKNIRDR